MEGKNAGVLTYVLEKYQLSEEDNAYASVKIKVKNLNSNFADKWKNCNRTGERPTVKRFFGSCRSIQKAKNFAFEILSFAVSTSLRQSGKRDAASMVKVITSGPSVTANNMKKLLSTSIVTAPIKYTPEEALALAYPLLYSVSYSQYRSQLIVFTESTAFVYSIFCY
ncbi:uncharacterized protein LOC144472626 [Augochlora pura]